MQTRQSSLLGLALLIAALNAFLWLWSNPPLALPEPAGAAGGQVHGLAYAPFQRWNSPAAAYTGGHFPSEAELSADLRQIARLTREVRTYSAAAMPALPALAAAQGLQVTLGVWLDRNYANNTKEIAAALQAANASQAVQGQSVRRLIVGNETVLHRIFTPAQLTVFLQQVRAGTSLPVSTAEPWHVWLTHPELAEQVDFITIHLLPYWEGIDQPHAVQVSMEHLAQVRARFPGKPIVIGEIGYPSGGDTIKSAVPTPATQAAFVREFVARARVEKLDYFLMEAVDQPWKQTQEGRAGAFWGVLNAAREPKFSFSGAIERDPYWRGKALGSSVAGFIFLLWFMRRSHNLRWRARIAFAVTAQAILSLATVLVTLPFLHYLRPGDWLMVALLVPCTLAMVAILLAHLFEFVELFWEGSLRRRFVSQPMPQEARQPYVSIHLACCNEAPEMVIATIQSLRDLDYQAYEVLVIDNNTRDPALWEPVRDFMAGLPAHFRFIHLPTWPGYKAGALNFALAKTDPRAEVIAVVDADYVVRPEWLRGLVGYFADAQVGIVQAPQAHREWGNQLFRKMMNWEYEGFFRIGMHHRNERDAIIQHGTMTLIRASALRQHGQWSEWCLCEDAELGLRLMRQGLRTVYVDQVMGEGLTPDSFAAFKQQRVRWAQGGMQIFKAHWRVLLGIGASSVDASAVARLTRGQRYHFLAGWLPWVGDALHLLFVLAALLWTAGVLAWPDFFSLPVPLLMLPLGVFCATKLVIGPLLYWRRVPCSVGGIVGAALAGMALSHGIARGVFAGLGTQAGVFKITAKGGTVGSTAGGKAGGASFTLGPVREELFLLGALLLAMLAIAQSSTLSVWLGDSVWREHHGAMLWIGMLALQALPYLAAVVCAWVAALPPRHTGQATQITQVARPVALPQSQIAPPWLSADRAASHRQSP